MPNHCLTIGKEGRVKANVYTKSMLIEGEVSGDLVSSESVSIRATAKIRGNVLAARVSLEEGAHFKGSIDMDPKSVERALLKRDVKAVASDSGGSERAKPATLANVKSSSTETGAAQKAAGDKKL